MGLDVVVVAAAIGVHALSLSRDMQVELLAAQMLVQLTWKH